MFDVINESIFSWERELLEIKNTSLRRKTIVFGCRSSLIGNNRCDIECRHPITGDDGGDCKQNCESENCFERPSTVILEEEIWLPTSHASSIRISVTINK
ncbi:unnamed protein product [Anisakis simplex]|uniref:Uncharacterized protein n=1 Tax=Anisakis simplex TaxID=6269 RepID=A0A0M3J9Z2_ANISI|nr:unnamed protein product [Anisakis simplex]